MVFNRNDACLLFERRSRDGRVAEQLEQSSILLQDLPGTPKPKTVLVDLGFRGVDQEVRQYTWFIAENTRH